jgi:nucleotide-binding universal stress UspA family protein
MSEKRRRILLAIDGSEQAFDAIRYVAAFFPPAKTDVVLFHVDAGIPEALLDQEKSPEFRAHKLPISQWALEARKHIDGAMEKGGEILIHAGFPPEAVSAKVQARDRGVARDILKEARQGYDAAVIGRSGLGNVENVVLGSVAHKLVTRIDPIPIAVVGGNPEPKKVLVGFDGSEGSIRAVDCVCSMMPNDEREVTLCLVVRSLGAHLGSRTIFTPEHEKAWLELSRKEAESAFEEAENRLINAGFHPGHIFLRTLENHTSRATGIKAATINAGSGTIVVGRRGLSTVEEFAMGRVTRKVLQIADDTAVWVV